MRWSAVLTECSLVALLAAVATQLLGWPVARAWFLLAWAVLLLGVIIGLFRHPMRWPAWGLFVGFWGLVGVAFLLVVQVLALWDVLSGGAYFGWAAWPLALIGLWILVASALGFGGEGFPRAVDGLGILTGAGLLAMSVSTWASADDTTRAAGLMTAAFYCMWALALGVCFWRIAPAVTGRAEDMQAMTSHQ